MSKTITLAELADEFGLVPRSAARKLRILTNEHGFPKPLPGFRSLWSRDLVEAWIRGENLGTQPREASAEAGGSDGDAARDYVAKARAALERRYGGRR